MEAEYFLGIIALVVFVVVLLAMMFIFDWDWRCLIVDCFIPKG